MAVYSGAGGRSCPEHQLYRPAIPTAAALAAAPARRTGGDEEKQRREEVDRRCGKMQASLRGHFSSILLAVCSLSCSVLLTVLLTF